MNKINLIKTKQYQTYQDTCIFFTNICFLDRYLHYSFTLLSKVWQTNSNMRGGGCRHYKITLLNVVARANDSRWTCTCKRLLLKPKWYNTFFFLLKYTSDVILSRLTSSSSNYKSTHTVHFSSFCYMLFKIQTYNHSCKLSWI